MSEEDRVAYIVECIKCPKATIVLFEGMEIVEQPEGWRAIDIYSFLCPEHAGEQV